MTMLGINEAAERIMHVLRSGDLAGSAGTTRHSTNTDHALAEMVRLRDDHRWLNDLLTECIKSGNVELLKEAGFTVTFDPWEWPAGIDQLAKDLSEEIAVLEGDWSATATTRLVTTLQSAYALTCGVRTLMKKAHGSDWSGADDIKAAIADGARLANLERTRGGG